MPSTPLPTEWSLPSPTVDYDDWSECLGVTLLQFAERSQLGFEDWAVIYGALCGVGTKLAMAPPRRDLRSAEVRHFSSGIFNVDEMFTLGLVAAMLDDIWDAMAAHRAGLDWGAHVLFAAAYGGLVRVPVMVHLLRHHCTAFGADDLERLWRRAPGDTPSEVDHGERIVELEDMCDLVQSLHDLEQQRLHRCGRERTDRGPGGPGGQGGRDSADRDGECDCAANHGNDPVSRYRHVLTRTGDQLRAFRRIAFQGIALRYGEVVEAAEQARLTGGWPGLVVSPHWLEPPTIVEPIMISAGRIEVVDLVHGGRFTMRRLDNTATGWIATDY